MQIPFFKEIADSKSILIVGAGGGFDIVSGLPLYSYLRSLGKQVVLANLSFAALPFSNSEETCFGMFRITEQSEDLPYFPEKYILEWLRSTKNEAPEMYALSNKMGVAPLSNAYAKIVDTHSIDTAILVDGGTDSLMFGDESSVGTIIEDACSIVAAAKGLPTKTYVAAIGFGVEHDLNHHACLENIATLAKSGDYLGALSLSKEMPEGQDYLDLVEFLNQKMIRHQSIVTNSIASALNGEFGDHHATRRTQGTIQFVSPLMSLYWFVKLSGIASRIGFAPMITESETMADIVNAFKEYRQSITRRAYQDIPLK